MSFLVFLETQEVPKIRLGATFVKNTSAPLARCGKIQELTETLPSVIHSEEENERFIAVLEKLERRSTEWSQAEAKLAELLTLLIEEFENENYELKAATPIDVLRELMESNDLKQKDSIDVLGVESTVSAVLNGKRDMTREHIKGLSDRFHVSPEVFF